MDSYANKFASMQHYVPFLDRMIRKLEKCKDREKQAQLEKMKSLYGILTDPSKKVRFEVLLKCEEVLKKLYEKVEGVGDNVEKSVPPPVLNSNQRNFSPNRSRENTPRSPDREPRNPSGGGPQSRFNRKGVGLLGDAPNHPPNRGHPSRPDPWGGQRPPGPGQGPPPRGFQPHHPPWQQRHPSVPPGGPGGWHGPGTNIFVNIFLNIFI